MDYWPWDSSLNIGIEAIDIQHRRIVDNINRLHLAAIIDDNDKVREVLVDLIDYTKTHFTFEEALMEKAGYPLTESHKELHKEFISRIKRHSVDHMRGEDVRQELTEYLKDWLMNHIKQDDKDYAPVVQKSLHKHQGWIGKTVKRLFG